MLYHKDTGIPFKTTLPKTIQLFYTPHAIMASKNDRYGHVELETTFSTRDAEVIELETDDRNQPVKLVIRKPYDSARDIVVVVLINETVRGANIVKTVWINLKTDTHSTLNRGAYAKVG